MRKGLQLAGATLALGLLAGWGAAPARAAVDGHFDRTLTVNGPVDLDVTTGAGNITIHPGDASKVEIHATIHAGENWRENESDAEQRVKYLEAHPPIEQNGNTITVGHIEDRDLTRNISISYDITTPAQTRLHSATGSGNQTVDGLAGPAEASSGSGDVRLNGIGADVNARTGSGEITVSGIKGILRASSGSGNIRGDQISGAITASTGSGDVRLTQAGSGDVEVSTGSGTVEVNGVNGGVQIGTGSGNIRAEGTPAGNWRLHTGSGDLTVELPQQSSFELYAHTSSGSIDSKFPITVQGTINPRELHGKVGNGGPTVELRTSSGTIHIESK
jgi:DUF4097 and DUF4098 domain-containing protein YvlB